MRARPAARGRGLALQVLLLLVQVLLAATAGTDILQGKRTSALSSQSEASSNSDIVVLKAPPDGCVRLKAVKMNKGGPKPIATGKILKLVFELKNPSATKTSPPYTYVLRLDTPPRLTYVEAYALPKLRTTSFAPVVGNNMLLWEIENIPGTRSKQSLMITFRVTDCADSPLQFRATGFKDVDNRIQCETRLILPPIPVVRDPMVDCNTTTSAPTSNLPPNAPTLQVYGPPGTRCIEPGVSPNLVNPTLDECFIACSFLVQQQPMFINYISDAQGNPQCRCLNDQCTLVDIGGRRQRRSRNLFQARLQESTTSEAEAASTTRDALTVRAMGSYGAYEITVLATHSPTGSPTGTPTQRPTGRPTTSPTPAPTVDCLAPEIFNANRFHCETKFCKPYMYRIRYLNLSTTYVDDPTHYDVCRLTCSSLELGDEGNAETAGVRVQCQDRCREAGYQSFLCQAYCTDFPTDLSCPQSNCDSLSSMRTNLEYCSQQVCDVYFPMLGAPLSPKNQSIYDLCEYTCSAQQLGPMDTAATRNQRQRCREMCAVDGVERSFMCLQYCLSFPNDTSVCPPPSDVAAVVQRKTHYAPPTASPTQAPTVQCRALSVFKEHPEFCDKTFCASLLWKLPYLPGVNATEESPTATTVCQSTCSSLALGPLHHDANGTIVASPQRIMCQDRCGAEGYSSFLCQVYCRDFPSDPVCPKPDCASLESVTANLEYCDRNYCSVLYPPTQYTTPSSHDKEEDIALCKLPCSAQQLGRIDDALMYDATLPMRKRCRARCEIDGPQSSVMCISYCLSFPNDPVCQAATATVQTMAGMVFAPVDCLTPDVFVQNMAHCDPLCPNWLSGMRYANATSNPQMYDVCSWACSVQNVGLAPSNETAAVRETCRERCRTDGVESFVCRRYCRFFPDDPACPKPDCQTYESIERDPEYCDQTACVNYLPGVSYLVSTVEDQLQENVCTLACSRQRLGDEDNLNTIPMRGHCKHLCEVQGPATSRLCLSYCVSYPSDPVCPPPAEIERILARTASPTPSPTATAFEQHSTPLLANYTAGTPIPAISQLELGYNPFLGLLPHEQLGIYVRHPIFQFHVDPMNRFVLQQGQTGGTAQFVAPIEYYLSPELADCSYSSISQSSLTRTAEEYLSATAKTYSWGMADIDVNGGVSTKTPHEEQEEHSKKADAGAGGSGGGGGGGEIEMQPLRRDRHLGDDGPSTTKDIKLSTKLSAVDGHSSAAQQSRIHESQGLTQSITTTLKRRYYRAGLRVDRFTADSFTPSFRADAKALVDGPYSFNRTMDFITKYGAYIYDGATLGASLWRSYFFSSEATVSEIQDVTDSEEFLNVNALVKHQNDRGATLTHKSADGTVTSYSYTDVERVGEFNTGPSASDGVTSDSCAIGATIAPQVIEFALKPLWDNEIPLNTFMTTEEVNQFRFALWNATTTQLAYGNTCADVDGNDCYGTGGMCLPTYSRETGAYNYSCVNPIRDGSRNTFQFQIFVFGLEIAQQIKPPPSDGQNVYPTWWGHHTANFNSKNYPTQYGIYGYNIAKIYKDVRVYGFVEHCANGLGGNFWTQGSPPLPCTEVPNNFTVAIPDDMPRTLKIELLTRGTRGIMEVGYCCKPGPRTFEPGSNFDCDSSHSHLPCNVLWYEQPSMGVAICPTILRDDGSTDTLGTCYYAFRFAAGVSTTQGIANYGRSDGGKIGYVPQYDARPDKSEWTSPAWAATKEPIADNKYITLTFDLKRTSSAPENVQATADIAVNDAAIPIQTMDSPSDPRFIISYPSLMDRLALGMNTYLN